MSAKKKFREMPKLYLLEFQALSFGDGTGYLGAGATFVSTKKENSQLYNDNISLPKITSFFLSKMKSHLAQ
jgi:hypothetical protein